jgi:hypothetical protein
MRRVTVYSTALLIAIAAAGVQGAAAQSIDPGMTKSQVIERLGAPAAERSTGAYTYLFYQNGREYTGRSSSPEGVIPANSGASGERLAMPVANPPDATRSP